MGRGWYMGPSEVQIVATDMEATAAADGFPVH